MMVALIILGYLMCGFITARRVYIQDSENFKRYYSKWKCEWINKPEDMVIWPYVFAGPFLLMLWGIPYLGRPFHALWKRTIKGETPAMRKEREAIEYKKNLAVIEDKPKEIKRETIPVIDRGAPVINNCRACRKEMIYHWSGLCGACQAKFDPEYQKKWCGHEDWERFPD